MHPPTPIQDTRYKMHQPKGIGGTILHLASCILYLASGRVGGN